MFKTFAINIHYLNISLHQLLRNMYYLTIDLYYLINIFYLINIIYLLWNKQSEPKQLIKHLLTNIYQHENVSVNLDISHNANVW